MGTAGRAVTERRPVSAVTPRSCLASLTLHVAAMLHPAAAQQVRGHVVDERGTSVPMADIALWRGERIVLSRHADAEGRFSVPLDSLSSASGIAARAIGFRPTSLHVVTPGSDSLVIVLGRYATPLPELVATTAAQRCPNREDPEATATWQRMRAQTLLAPLTTGLAAVQHRTIDVVSASEVSRVPNDLPPGSSEVDAGYRVTADRFIRDSGYAVRKRPDRISWVAMQDDAYLDWWYPRLDWWDSDHFARDAFGQRVTLSFGPSEAGDMILIFCPKDTRQPGIRGTLRIGAGFHLREARWRFVTGKPEEDAGGEVTFLVGQSSRLLPLQALYWRRLGGRKDRYYREVATFDGWLLGGTGRVPSLDPSRATTIHPNR